MGLAEPVVDNASRRNVVAEIIGRASAARPFLVRGYFLLDTVV
jgi:hypothetical protein